MLRPEYVEFTVTDHNYFGKRYDLISLQYIIDHLFFSRAYSVQSSPSDKGKISGKLKMIQYFPGEYFRLRSSHHHGLSRLTQTIQQLRNPRIYLVFKPAHSRKTYLCSTSYHIEA